MSAESIAAPTTAAEHVSQDLWPQVSFDINLGQQLDEINFDYPAYANYLQGKGLRPEEIQATKILIEPAPDAKAGIITGLGSVAAYNPIDKDIHINVPTKVTNKAFWPNVLLVHETQHYIDDIQGKTTRKDSILNVIGHLASFVSSPLVFVPTIFIGDGYFTIENWGLDVHQKIRFLGELGQLNEKVAAGALGALIVSKTIHKFSGPEKSARAAAEDAPSIITMDPEPEDHTQRGKLRNLFSYT